MVPAGLDCRDVPSYPSLSVASQSRAQLPGLDAKTSSLLAIPVATRASGLTAPTSLLVLLQCSSAWSS